ncbi:MAG: pantetheine-phosphate adenylyltransferase [Oscillospiraceae bacterium]|jgi:pantetheine-phosphate adenylyltransferase|nr:pantetheine-phosphate adenylyltransferase [Oscillospiraceae bacterium]
MRIAICPGSFDPITNGHLEVIRRAAGLFDEVIVVVAVNAEKRCLFSAAERMDFIRRCTKAIPNVSVDVTDGLIAHYAQRVGAAAIVKGLRALSDFDAEFQQALTNRQLNAAAETVFLAAGSDSMYLSSSMVKQVCVLGGDVGSFVPPEVLSDIVGRILRTRDKPPHS